MSSCCVHGTHIAHYATEIYASPARIRHIAAAQSLKLTMDIGQCIECGGIPDDFIIGNAFIRSRADSRLLIFHNSQAHL